MENQQKNKESLKVEEGQTTKKNHQQNNNSKFDGKYSQQNGSKQQNYKNVSQNQKSGRPCREIYRPPSLRSKSSRNSQKDRNRESIVDNNNGNFSSGVNSCGGNKNSSSGGGKSQGNGHNNSNPSVNGGSSSVTNSPMVNRRSFTNGPNIGQRGMGLGVNLNANAKEFQLTAQQQQQQLQGQQIAALLSQLDSKFYSEVLAASSNLYSLQQSKSLGNNLNLLQQQQQHQLTNSHNFPFAGNYTPFGPYQAGFNNFHTNSSNGATSKSQNFQEINGNITSPFNRLSQSKSSGSIPNTVIEKPRVRFDDMIDANEVTFNTLKNAESRFSSLNMNGLQRQQERPALSSQGQQPLLQKSRTGFLLNLYTTPHQQQGILKHEVTNNQQNKSSSSLGTTPIHDKGFTNSVKRSRSFGSTGKFPLAPSINSVYSDFRISKWPKKVQETVTAAVTANERIAARQQIEMVTMIFDAMLHYDIIEKDMIENTTGTVGPDSPNWRSTDNNTTRSEINETDDDDDCFDLTTPAVYIFLYFIQKEKDRTVMESLLNTYFATFQKLFGNSSSDGSQKESNSLRAEVAIFLKFLSTLYSQVRLLRSQRQQNGGSSIDEMSFSLLALLCDSCLALLRSRLSNDPALMSSLFTLMTSQGRDMETTFPLKMKQLLAAVRDTLLGLGPYCKGPLCLSVQKTLMQLIELHAANWALPASAVRYYYSNSSNNSVTKNGQNNTQRSTTTEVVHASS